MYLYGYLMVWALFSAVEGSSLVSGEEMDSEEALEEAPPQPAPPAEEALTLSCHRRAYRARVERRDAAGRRCWDTLALPACWGRCDSLEVSEWKFPYKKSRHPVCGFAAHVTGETILRNCDPGAAPGTELFVHALPAACRCHACEGARTTCGWLPGPNA